MSPPFLTHLFFKSTLLTAKELKKNLKNLLYFNSYLSVSGPFLAIIIFSFPSPPTGALSVPVVNWRNSLFCSSVNEWTISQNSLQR